MEKRRLRDVIGPALFEATFVVLGVILALAANEWRQQAAQQAQARAALEEITQELHANQRAVAESSKYHRGLIGRIQQSARDGEPLDGGDFSRGFIAPAPVYSTAWSSASDTGAVANMPYNTVLALSRLYALQQDYREQAKSIGQIIYAELYRGGTKAIIDNADHLIHVIYAFVYREQQILSAYEGFLTTADRKGDELNAGGEGANP